MELLEQLNDDLKQAMRDKDVLKRRVLRSVITTVREEEQANKEELIKKALKKNSVQKPSNQQDADAMAAYNQAVEEALASEKVEENAKLGESEIFKVLQKMVKMRQDSIEEARGADRDDIADEEAAEVAILEEYLPKQMSREEIEEEARAQIEAVGAETMRDMGKVMGPLTQKLQGRADGKIISEVVRGLLNN